MRPWPRSSWSCGGWGPAGRPGCRGWPRWTAGAPPGPTRAVQAGSTAGWLRARLRPGAAAAASSVRTARALFRGPRPDRPSVDRRGDLARPRPGPGPRHPRAGRPCHRRGRTGLLEAARRLDHPGCGGLSPTCGWSPTPRAPRTARRGSTSSGACGCRAPSRGWSPSTGCWSRRPARSCSRPEPLARPANADDAQRQPTPGRRPHRAGPPQPRRRTPPPDRWGPTPADRDRGPGQPPGRPRHPGWGDRRAAGSRGLPRLACDGAVTRVLVTRHPGHDHDHDHGHRRRPGWRRRPAARLRAAARLSPGPGWGSDPAAGGGPDQPGW